MFTIINSKDKTLIQSIRVQRLTFTPEPDCSKLTMSLVKVLLNFQTLISQIHQYFLLKKCEKLAKASLIFQQTRGP